jgi:hypothetical protein
MGRFFHSVLLGAALLAPVATPVVLRAQEHVYHDAVRNDDHHWDQREDKAYRIWVKENHRKYRDFAKLKAEDQRAYWAWRHQHSDAELKIDIR